MISGIGTAVLGGSLNTSSNIELTVSNQVISLPISFNKFNNPVINSRNNKTFKTIQGAIDDVNTRDGDTLKLKAGVYLENICIFKKISLVSFGDGEVLIIPKNESISSTVIVSNDNVSLKNLSIYGTVSSDAVFSTGNSFSLINSKVFNSFAGVYLYSTNNACLLNNSISGCSYALYLDENDNGLFINNTIFNNDYGILAKYSNINLFKTNALFNNWIGVEDSSKYNQFVSNDIHDNYQGIRLIASSSALLENTSVYGNYIGLLKYGSSFMNKSSDVYNNSLVNVQSLSDGDIIIQDNMWYCGPAALSIIFENLGLTASQKDIANIAGTNTNGTSLYGLYQACLSYGFNSTVWMLSSSDLRINDLIVLLFDGEYHFSAVYDINESAVVLNDPSIGLFELSRETFDELFSGYVLDVEPVKDRGVKVSVTQMKSVVGTNPLVIAGLVLDPVVLLGGAVVMAAAWTGWQIGAYAGELYNSWRKHNKSPSYKKRVTQYKNPNGHYYVSYPTYGGNKGNRVKAISPSSVSYSFGNAKYYVKGHGYLSKSSLNKLGISSTQLAEIAYQESYNYYLKTKNKERLKVGEPSEFSIICRERELYKHLNAAGDGGNITKQHSLDNILTYARNLPEFSTRTSSKGTELIRLGIKNSSPKLVAKGIRYISISVISSAGFASVMVKYSPFISIIVISKLSD